MYIFLATIARKDKRKRRKGEARDWNQLGNRNLAAWPPVAVAVAASSGVALIDSAA